MQCICWFYSQGIRTKDLVLGFETRSKTVYHNIRTLLGQTWLRHEPVRMCSKVYKSATSSLLGPLQATVNN
jgi:hypothetical protein